MANSNLPAIEKRLWATASLVFLAAMALSWVVPELGAGGELRSPLRSACAGRSLDELVDQATAAPVAQSRRVQTENLGKAGPGGSAVTITVVELDLPGVVKPALNDSERVQALQCLGQVGGEQVFDDLERLFQRGEDSQVVLEATALAMARTSPQQAQETLLRALTDRRERYVVAALCGLTGIRGEQVTEGIASMLDHSLPSVRWRAGLALNGRPYAEIRTFIIKMLRDRDCRALDYCNVFYESQIAADDDFLAALERLSRLHLCQNAEIKLEKLREMSQRLAR